MLIEETNNEPEVRTTEITEDNQEIIPFDQLPRDQQIALAGPYALTLD